MAWGVEGAHRGVAGGCGSERSGCFFFVDICSQAQQMMDVIPRFVDGRFSDASRCPGLKDSLRTKKA